MIDIILPELPERELALVSEEFTGPSGHVPRRPAAATTLAGRVALGGPLSVPVTTELVGRVPELKAYVESEANKANETDSAAYHLVYFSVSCPQETANPQLHTVNLDLTLSADPAGNRRAVFQPVAWSMTPLQLSGEARGAGPAHLGPRLGFVGQDRATRGARVCLEARRELRSDPGWEIRRTPTASIKGTYRLAMVVRAPRATVSRAVVEVGATVREGHALRRFRAELPEPLLLATG
ncbi:hypothetical protein [Streptomyces sp. ME19-01-6]|uniref:hypothetical protein n=1 Tax=Streptomyces sp. ME19-01-6 TaxID=3028686 RepID=UPI0029AC0D5C|nr:hypothetical protein [Streptomyces sp. ME19-01-6]MDX3228756.1 hypothetical protein [Streptomyces sp. ME19-01-6]